MRTNEESRRNLARVHAIAKYANIQNLEYVNLHTLRKIAKAVADGDEESIKNWMLSLVDFYNNRQNSAPQTISLWILNEYVKIKTDTDFTHEEMIWYFVKELSFHLKLISNDDSKRKEREFIQNILLIFTHKLGDIRNDRRLQEVNVVYADDFDFNFA